MKFYFAGQDNFGNRGCEALIRASVKLIRANIPDAQFLVPSSNIEVDHAQWPDAKLHGVNFIKSEPFPNRITWWSRLKRVFKFVENFQPKFKLSNETLNSIRTSDALIMTGGDIISLDYGLESLYYWAGICDAAIEMGKPTILWAASVGPFSSNPGVETRMTAFLKRFSLITVRETSTLQYLKQLGIENVQSVIDPAFELDPQDLPVMIQQTFDSEMPILGFNVSPLIRKFREQEESKDALDNEVANFLIKVLSQSNFKVMLIPHVDPLNGATENSDSAYMKKILEKVRKAGFGEKQINILPSSLNASQLKAAIKQCRYFMGARTHATVAALSQLVPTTSIAYSIKAKGINNDLFGHNKYVLETPLLTSDSLRQHLDLLIHDDQEIRSHLNQRIPEWKKKAALSVDGMQKLLQK